MRVAFLQVGLLCVLTASLGCEASLEAPLELGRDTHPVIGGAPTPEGSYPATGALVLTFDGEPFFVCTGTLIAPRVVLTAAHCLDPDGLGGQVPSFTLALVPEARDATRVAGVRAILHPDYDGRPTPSAERLGQWDDLGLLILEEALDVPFATLPTADEAHGLVAGRELEIVGYGLTVAPGNEADEELPRKHHATTTLEEVGTHELWVGAPGDAQNCLGDSGGPAYARLKEDGELRVVGIVSHGAGSCDEGGVDTRVDAYLAWILEELSACMAIGSCGDGAGGGGAGGVGGVGGARASGGGGAAGDGSGGAAPLPDSGGGSDGAGCGCTSAEPGAAYVLACALVGLGLRRRPTKK